MKHGEIIRLLVVEETGTDADALANELTQAGHPVHHTHAASLDAIASALAGQSPDIVICGSSPDLPAAETVCNLLLQHGSTAPLIAIADSAPEAAVARAKKTGIHELVSYEHPEHLHLVFAQHCGHIRQQQQIARLQDQLRAAETRCHALIEHSSDAIAYIHDGMHVYANQPYLKLFGIDADNGVDGTPVLDFISPDGRETFKEILKQVDDGNSPGKTLKVDCISPLAGAFECSMECTPATMDGEPCTQMIIRVNHDSHQLAEQLRELSRMDTLTGLLNRQQFMHELAQHISTGAADDREAAVIFIALDNFKAIRESIGIAASDQVLRNIAALLQSACPADDLISRFGDFSFAILARGNDQAAMRALAELILGEISGHLSRVEGRAVALTASIGMCAVTANTRDAQQLISNSDMACEVARTSGGNQVHAHSVIMDTHGEKPTNHASLVRDTIENERFYLVYQPIVSLAGDTTPRYEVLLRVHDPEGKSMQPGQFLAISQDTGHSEVIDRWIIDNAFASLSRQQSAEPAIFFLKLSAASMADNDLSGWISGRLQEYQLTGNRVIFEVQEKDVLADLSSSINFVEAMHAMGCAVALEHYTGIDNPHVLQHVPADIIKIDGSLITSLSSDKQAQLTVGSIIKYAAKSGKTVIAESVEDPACLAVLWQFGVDCIQGNFIQQPGRTLDYVFENEIA